MTLRRCLLIIAGLLVAVPSGAGAQHFGRNKVQYRSFDFRIIKTEHFDVYYYEQEEVAARDAARAIERGYARLSRLLQHEFTERKPVILYASHSDFQQTNALYGFVDESTGGATEPLKDRIVMPLTGSYADWEHVLIHELVHAFQFDVIFRRSMMSDASPFGARLPLWFMEGMAEYLSLGDIDAHTVSWLRDASMSGYLRDIGEMSTRDDYLSYRFGQSLWSYIGEKWGDEVIGILLQKAPRIGIPRAFESTLGVDLQELSNEWIASVRSTYLPQMTRYEDPDRIARRITKHDRLEDPWFLSPALSPDGKTIAYLSQAEGFSFDLYIADVETGKVRRKLVEGSQENFESLRYMSSAGAFSPDGRFFAFSAQTGGRDALYLYDLKRRRVAKKLEFELNGVSNPSWSPDGKRIVFTGLDGGISDLFVTNLDGELERLTNDRYADLVPSWSPDGKTIAFSTDRGPDTDFDRLVYGNLRVALLDLASNSILTLPHQELGKNLNPVWAPDGESLVWVSDRDGVNNLYLFDSADRSLARISDFLSGAIAVTPLSPVLSWSREDGGRFAFLYFEDAGYNLYVLDDPRTLSRTPVAELAGIVAEAPVEKPQSPIGDYLPIHRDETGSPGQVASFYRTDTGEFRASDTAPPGVEGSGPLSVRTLMERTQDDLPAPDELEVVDYDVKFTPDVIGRPTIGAQVGGYYGNGVYGGSFIALSDMLGNHNIMAAGNINGSISDAQLYTAYTYLKTRANFGVSLEQVPFYRYLGGGAMNVGAGDDQRSVVADVFMRDVIRTASGMMSYPFSQFRRVEAGIAATHFQRDVLYRGYDAQSYEPFRRDERVGGLSYVQPSAALVFDNSIFGWTGPVKGRRYRLQLSQSFGDFTFTELLADVRNYLNLAGPRAILASRLVTLARIGGDADRFGMYWGGPYFIRGYDGNSFPLGGEECEASRSVAPEGSISACPVRDQLIGSSAAFVNMELRVPVITELQLGFLGSFPPVDGVVFVDGGLAWDDRICLQTDATMDDQCAAGMSRDVSVVWNRRAGEDPYLVREPLFSYGVGLRLNVFYTVLRLDYTVPVSRIDRAGRFSVAFGPSF